MDDKELVTRIRNSFKAGKSRAEITRGMTQRGYKLEYTEALIRRAKRPKKIFITLAIFLVITISLLTAVFAVFDNQPTTISGEVGISINNPLDGFRVLFMERSEGDSAQANFQGTEGEEIYLEDIEITPDFIKYILQEIGALGTLHKNPVTREVPMINFKIGDVGYNAKFKEILEVSNGLNSGADIQFNSNKEVIVRAILDDNPAEIFKKSIFEGTTTIDTIAGETELFAKGYLALYDSLK